MEKNILFYSQHCDYSKRLLKILNDERIGHNLVRICVDGICNRLPKFVTGVPAIFLRESQSILMDDQLQEWINHERQSQQSKDFEAYSLTGSSFSASFSSIDGSDDLSLSTGMYSVLNGNDSAVVNSRNVPKSEMSNKYDQLIAERQKLVHEIKRT